ncbi:MAG: UbiA family prenyltransferase, partial [Lutibacter sp.]
MAGGYLINNMYDYKIDKINKPESYLFSKTHSLNNVKSAYWIIIGLSIILIIYFSFIINNLYAAIIFISSIFLLNLYARKLKSFGLIGNLLIAFLIA